MTSHEQNLTSVRTRAIELSSAPDLFEQPQLDFETPGEYKREADAYLAICSDAIIPRIAESDDHKSRFVDDFVELMKLQYDGKPNDRINGEDVGRYFGKAFNDVYVWSPIVNEVMDDTPLGRRTAEACRRYAMSVEDYMYSHRAVPQIGKDHEEYFDARKPIRNGIGEAGGLLKQAIALIPHDPSPIEAREAHARAMPFGFLRLSALSLDQLRKRPIEPTVDAQGVRLDADIDELRSLPEYSNPVHEIARPAGKCIALPRLPQNEMLTGGSALDKMARLCGELLVATNVYALGINDPEHSIMGSAVHKPV